MIIFTYLVIDGRIPLCMAYFNRNDGQNDRGNYGGRRDSGDRGGQGRPRGDRRMYPVVCDKCGRDCEVPFRPDGSKPIYCSDCFERQGGGQRRDSFGGGRKFDNRRAGQSQNLNGEVLASINSKLAQILELMRKNEKPKRKVGVKKTKKAKGKKVKK